MILLTKLHLDSFPKLSREPKWINLNLWLGFCSLLYGTIIILTLYICKLFKDMLSLSEVHDICDYPTSYFQNAQICDSAELGAESAIFSGFKIGRIMSFCHDLTGWNSSHSRWLIQVFSVWMEIIKTTL
jgi:hypothetical protein